MAIRTLQRSGSRFYFDTAEPDKKVPGVTSVIGMLAKPFLAPWNARMVAELAVDSIEFIADMAERDRQGAIDYLKGAAWRYTKNRANVGSDAHDLFERMMRGENVRYVHPDLEPYRKAFAEFLRVVNPELIRAEDVAWSTRYDYAGSFDAILCVWLDENGKPTPDRSGTPVVVIVDWKTSKDTHAEVAMQLAAYKNADFVISPDGTREAMPPVDGAFVLHITPDGWEFIPVVTDNEVFAAFLALRAAFDWDREKSRTVLGKPVAASAPKRVVTGTQRRGK